jgi:Polysaccharide pyruvyl transferase
MRIALLSHRGGNIGHDFMALGMEAVITATFGPSAEIVHYEQHRHFSIYPNGHPLHAVDWFHHGRLKAIRRYLNRPELSGRLWRGSKDLSADLAVTCGGPNIVAGASRSPEMGLMCHHMIGAFHAQDVPVIDAAVGTCFPLNSIPERIDDVADVKFYQRLFSYCAASTVRDELAVKLYRGLGREADLIPCAATAAGRPFTKWLGGNVVDPADRYIVINFQEKGANEDWGQGVDAKAWAQKVRALAERLQRRHGVAFLCHNENEVRLAKSLRLSLPVIYPRTVQAYATAIGNAKAALVSRIHAAISLAGIGVPSFVVGTDTRLGAVRQLGLPTCFVGDATTEKLEVELEQLLANIQREKERLLTVRDEAIKRYGEVFRQHIRGRG